MTHYSLSDSSAKINDQNKMNDMDYVILPFMMRLQEQNRDKMRLSQ